MNSSPRESNSQLPQSAKPHPQPASLIAWQNRKAAIMPTHALVRLLEKHTKLGRPLPYRAHADLHYHSVVPVEPTENMRYQTNAYNTAVMFGKSTTIANNAISMMIASQ